MPKFWATQYFFIQRIVGVQYRYFYLPSPSSLNTWRRSHTVRHTRTLPSFLYLPDRSHCTSTYSLSLYTCLVRLLVQCISVHPPMYTKPKCIPFRHGQFYIQLTKLQVCLANWISSLLPVKAPCSVGQALPIFTFSLKPILLYWNLPSPLLYFLPSSLCYTLPSSLVTLAPMRWVRAEAVRNAASAKARVPSSTSTQT